MAKLKKKIRVLVVDDSKFTRQVFKRVFRDDEDIEVVGEGRNGREAVELNLELEPDVITLDIDMPEMGGLEALEKIMASKPVAVLMVSSHTREQSELAFFALEKGAVDFVDKNSVDNTLDLGQLGNILRSKILAAAQAITPAPVSESSQDPRQQKVLPDEAPGRLVVIGASTGGPPVVQQIVKSISPSTRDAFVIVQHMPKGFTATFAARLSRLAQIEVREVEQSQRVCAGEVWVAKAGMLLEFRLDGEGYPLMVPRADLGEYKFKPSIDLAMETAACYGAKTGGILLTGMGDDGAEGMAAIESAGGAVWVQDPSTAVLPSMPSATIRGLKRPMVMNPMELTRVFSSHD